MLSFASKLLGLFHRGDRWKLPGILLAVLVTAAVETFAVASIIPFMAVVGDPSVLDGNPFLAYLYRLSGVGTPTRFLVLLAGFSMAFLTIANAFSAFTIWSLQRFAWGKNHEFSTRLLRGYINQPYSELLNRNTSELSKNILTEVQVVITGVLIPTIYILVQGTLCVMLLALLVAVDGLLALAVLAVLGSAYGMIYLVFRGRQGRAGKARLDANTDRFRMASEALLGAKEVKALRRESEFVSRYASPSADFAEHTAMNETVGVLPRYAMEIVAFGGMLAIVIYLLMSGEGPHRLLPTVSVYAFAGYKLLPSLQQIFRGLTTVRFFESALDTLAEGLREEEAQAKEARDPETSALVDFTTEITLSDLWFTYPDAEEPAIRDVSLRLPRGAVSAFVGRSGSGKTTLVDLILGLLTPDEGSVSVDGLEINALSAKGWRRNVGYVPQEIFLLDESIADNIGFGLSGQDLDRDRVEVVSRLAQVGDFIGDLAEGYDTVVGDRGVRLSGGQRQRIGIARALYHDPELLVLDEGTSALDAVSEDLVSDAIRELTPAKTVILIAHRLPTVREADAIHVLEAGEVVASGTYEELMVGSSHFQRLAKAVLEEND